MRIEGPSRRLPPVNGKSGTHGSGAGRPLFAIDEAPVSSPAHVVPAVSAPADIDAILALQAVEDPLLAKQKTVRRGRSLLDTLETIRCDLLAGQVSEERLERLLALVRQTRERVDPELDAAIEDIELRALVELAKFGRYVT